MAKKNIGTPLAPILKNLGFKTVNDGWDIFDIPDAERTGEQWVKACEKAEASEHEADVVSVDCDHAVKIKWKDLPIFHLGDESPFWADAFEAAMEKHGDLIRKVNEQNNFYYMNRSVIGWRLPTDSIKNSLIFMKLFEGVNRKGASYRLNYHGLHEAGNIANPMFHLEHKTDIGWREMTRFAECDVYKTLFRHIDSRLAYCQPADAVEYFDGVMAYLFSRYGIPKNSISLSENIMGAVVGHPGNGWMLRYLPTSMRTKDVCEWAISDDGESIWYVPESLITYKMCECAVYGSEWAIVSVLKKFQTKELWMTAAGAQMRGSDHPVFHMDNLDMDVLKAAIVADTAVLWHFQRDPKYQGVIEELLDYAMTTSWVALGDVSNENLSVERCKLAVKYDGLALQYVPDKLRNEEICTLALENANNQNRCCDYDASSDVEEFIPWDILEKLRANGVKPKKAHAFA